MNGGAGPEGWRKLLAALAYLDFSFVNNILTRWHHVLPGTGIASAPYLRLW